MTTQTNSGAVDVTSLAKGDEVLRVQYTIDRSDLVKYAGASGDFNPIHWSQSSAESVGLPNVIAHGMLTMALAGRAVSQWCGDPGRVVQLGARFTQPIVVPDGQQVAVDFTVTVHDVTPEQVVVNVNAKCDGVSVLGKCRATVLAPRS